MVRIKYYGPEPALQDCTLEIPVDPYIYHSNVLCSAIDYIINAIPDFDSLSLSDDVFNSLIKGDKEVLIHWKVIMQQL